MRYLFCLLLVCWLSLLSAQDSTNYKPNIWEVPKFKTDIFSPIFYLKEIRFSYEFPIAEKKSCQVELTFIQNNFIKKYFADIPLKLGFRIKADYRYYFQSNSLRGFYLSPEIFYKYENIQDESWFYRGDYSYLQLYDFTFHKSVFAAHFKLGAEFIQKSKYVYDFYLGLGLRYLNYNKDTPEDAIISNNSFRLEYYENYLLPSMCMGIQFGIGNMNKFKATKRIFPGF